MHSKNYFVGLCWIKLWHVVSFGKLLENLHFQGSENAKFTLRQKIGRVIIFHPTISSKGKTQYQKRFDNLLYRLNQIQSDDSPDKLPYRILEINNTVLQSLRELFNVTLEQDVTRKI